MWQVILWLLSSYSSSNCHPLIFINSINGGFLLESIVIVMISNDMSNLIMSSLLISWHTVKVFPSLYVYSFILVLKFLRDTTVMINIRINNFQNFKFCKNTYIFSRWSILYFIMRYNSPQNKTSRDECLEQFI